MNHLEVESLARDFDREQESGDDPGIESTGQPRVPVGIAAHEEAPESGKRQRISRFDHVGREIAKPLSRLDRDLARRTMNVLAREHIQTADEVEDALIEMIDRRREVERKLTEAAKSSPRPHVDDVTIDADDTTATEDDGAVILMFPSVRFEDTQIASRFIAHWHHRDVRVN